MIRFLALILAVFCASGAPTYAVAQTVGGFESPQFQTFLASDFMDRIRREALQRSMVLHQPDCMDLPEFEVIDTQPYDEVVMPDGIEIPLSGIWQERLTMSVCGSSATENMVHTFTEEGQRSFALVRGTTAASLETQLALVPEVVEIVLGDRRAEGCDVVRISGSAVTTEYSRSHWLERWNTNVCGTRVRLDIVLSSDTASGQTYSISLVN